MQLRLSVRGTDGLPLGYFQLCPKLMFESEATSKAVDVNSSFSFIFFFFFMQIRLISQKCLGLLWKRESLELRHGRHGLSAKQPNFFLNKHCTLCRFQGTPFYVNRKTFWIFIWDYSVFSLNFSSTGRRPFMAGKAKYMCQRHTFLAGGG